MNKKLRILPVIVALLIAQMACNMPGRGAEQATQLPAPNQTLTALFAITPASTFTATLPPIYTSTAVAAEEVTATTEAEQPTETSEPTATKKPTATRTKVPPTATKKPTAGRVVTVAKYLSTAPTLDGDWGEWKSKTTEYPANFVTYGRGSWTGEDDLSSSYHVGWDEDYLYIGVKVHDDKYVQNATGANIFKGDSLEILLDTNLLGDVYYDVLSADDYQLGVNPGRPDPEGTREAYLWYPSSLAGSRGKVKIGSILQDDGVYRVEAAIPWSIFDIDPASGKRFGFALSVSDNDNASSNVQQTMISNVPNRHLTDPTTWGELQLVK